MKVIIKIEKIRDLAKVGQILLVKHQLGDVAMFLRRIEDMCRELLGERNE